MNKKILQIFLLPALSILLFSCSGNKPAGPSTTVPVNLYTVHMAPASYYDDYPGNVVALSQVDLRAEVEGYITTILFKEGDHVHKGQTLYEIDKRKYLASYDQAVANVQVAKSNMEQAKKDADRYVYLNEHDAVAQQTLDHSLTSLQNAKNQLTAANQDMVRAQTDLKFSTITAPFDGTIGLSQVKLGTLVSPGQTILNTVSSDDPMAVDFVINEKQLNYFIKLQQRGNDASDSIFKMLTPDNTPYPYPGHIAVIDRGVDPQTGTTTIRTVFPNPAGGLRAGMSCTVRVHNQDREAQLIIPSKAVVEQMGEFFVFISKDTVINAPKDSKGPAPHLKAAQKKVQLGQAIGSDVIVKSGIQDGDQVIVDGVQKLHDGSVIMVTEQKPAAAASH
jgi:membrane fusion protein (multidrug efflux system)